MAISKSPYLPIVGPKSAKPQTPTGPYPGAGYHSVAASSALQRWLDQQKQSRAQFSAAEQPLRQAAGAFQPGGTYGRGQKTLLRDEARRAQAEATSQQVASGMSSGSLATGTKLRTERDLATNLAGVEDQRTQFMNQILQSMSGLRGTQAQTTAATVDPTYAPFMGAQASIYGANIAAQTARRRGGSSYGQYKPLPTLAGRGSVSPIKSSFSTPKF